MTTRQEFDTLAVISIGGVLGGYTTFSAYAVEMHDPFLDGTEGVAFGYLPARSPVPPSGTSRWPCGGSDSAVH